MAKRGTQPDTASAAENSNDVIFLGRVASRLSYLHWSSVRSNSTRTLVWHMAGRFVHAQPFGRSSKLKG